jgi:hypothetical protein
MNETLYLLAGGCDVRKYVACLLEMGFEDMSEKGHMHKYSLGNGEFLVLGCHDDKPTHHYEVITGGTQGYSGMYSTFYFDVDGKFVSNGAAE